MKKRIVGLSAAILGLVTILSCGKTQDWTCRCKESGSTTYYDYVLPDLTEKDAEEVCLGYLNSIPGVRLSCSLL